jgi:phosphoglycolate phosphatase
MLPTSPALPRYRLALFDFDGTLADSFPFFVEVLGELARRHSFTPVRPEQIPLMRRQDVRQNMKLVGMPLWKLPLVAASFVGLMRSRPDAVPLFDGVIETLSHLRRHGVTLALLTSNSVDNALRALGPANAAHFAYLEGRSAILGKQARIRKVLAHSGIPAAQALCIGDQLSDLRAARAAGVAFGAVAWGYGELASMREAGADEVFLDVAQMRRVARPA